MNVYILAETDDYDVLGIIGVYLTWEAAQAAGREHRERANKLFATEDGRDVFRFHVYEAPFVKESV